MKVSKGRTGRRLLGLAVIAAALVAGGAAFAELGQPAPWEYKLQASASPVMDNITWFHNFLLVIITAITLLVLALLVIVVVKFNAKANPIPSKTTHNTLIEVAWTIIPVLILVGIAVPSFRLLFEELDVPKADLTIKATGKQWYWSYAYPDSNFEFDSLILKDNERKPDQPRLLAVDNEIVVPVNKNVRVQVIGAHSADFVWRAGGAVAKAVAAGGTAEVIALSYGERGESGELWKQEGQTVDNVKKIRHAEAEAAAAHLGATFRCLDLGDYPLQIDGETLLAIADAIRAFAPDVLITHTDRDPFNPDHPVAYAAVDRARSLAAGAGVSSAFPTIKPPQLFLFEPHQPELCNFVPNVHVDITSVWDKKVAAMAEMKAQQYLQTYYAQRGEQRGNHARRASGDQAVRYGESFMRVVPQVVDQL